MLLIHPNTSCLAKLTSDDASRYGMRGIHVASTPTGYKLEATNGRYLGIVTGSNVGPEEEYPEIPALTSAPNGATTALIPAKEYEKACKDAPKRHPKAILQAVALVMGENCSTLGTTNLESNLVRQPRNIGERFPDTRDIVPKDAPKATIRVNPAMLAQLLQVAAEFQGTTGVEIELRGESTPIVIRTRNADQEFTGLLMPLT